MRPDDPPNRIRELREALGMSQADLAARVQVSQPQIDRLEKGQRKLTEDWRERLAPHLRVAPNDLLSGATSQPVGDIHRNASPERLVATRNSGGVELLPGVRPALTRDLPIRGHTKAGETGFFIDQGNHWGYAMRPESLRDVAEAYAVRVHDESMSPRYEPGEVLLVDPFRQTRAGDFVIIQLTDGQAFIKKLVRRAGGIVCCEQFNPKKEIEYKQAKVRAVHLVVGVDYLER